MAGQAIILREFHDTELLREYAALLEEHAIPYEIDDTTPRFDVTFSNDRSRHIYLVKVQPGDLEKARTVSAAADEKIMQELPADYYLFGFTNDELREVLVKSTEWNAFDVLLAEKLLKERGVATDSEDLRRKRAEHIDLLDQPEKADRLLIICGYILSVIGTLIGLFIALTILKSRKTLHDGTRIPRYSEATRLHATYMVLIFCIWLSLFFLFVFIGL